MKHSKETEQLFQQTLDETPKSLKLQVEWSYKIADRIDQLLRDRGLSQKKFAKIVGTSEAAVSHWVAGGHNFTLSTLAKISTALDVPLISITQ
ncbi:MAG: helix-turn-helix transcriptional regulator [Bacteroidales bacterium]|nr:helix-turn-helix transcriptional regulator [Bacteroidales bacterium]MBO7492297.1 helix-turn-helix transcriptional regulator [Bacteroidales bacterium]MBO7646522.1 helix-turn-helix transcriptional regulator [Bacteroidales bacterium]